MLLTSEKNVLGIVPPAPARASAPAVSAWSRFLAALLRALASWPA